MRTLEKLVTAVLLFYFLFSAPSTAHIIPLKLRSNGRQMIPLPEFEFTNAGHVSFMFSSITVTDTSTSSSSPPHASRIGFFLQSREDDFFDYSVESRNKDIFEFQQNTTICPLDFKLNSSLEVLFNFQNISHDSFMKSCPVANPGMRILFFVNCNNESLVTIDGHIGLYNAVDEGPTTKIYLSAGLTQLPFLYLILSLIYLSFLGFWILLCFKNRRIFNRTHLLMGGLLALSCVYSICVAADLHFVEVTGTAHGLDVAFYVFLVIRAVFLSTVIVLISSGWYFWKPFLKGEEKLVLVIVILFEVWANVDPIFPWEAAIPYNKDDLSIVDLICIPAVFFPIAWSIMSLVDIREIDLNADRTSRKLWLFTVLVFLYVLITKLFVLRLSSRWENYVVKETSILVFCMVVFYIFRPVDRRRVKDDVESTLSSWKLISCFYSPV